MNNAWWGLAIRMRQSVIKSTVNNLGWGFGRWNSTVRKNWLWRLQSAGLNPFNYTVDSLMAVLLRGSVLLMFLKIRTTSYVVSKAWTTRPSGRGRFCHLRKLRHVTRTLSWDKLMGVVAWRGKFGMRKYCHCPRR